MTRKKQVKINFSPIRVLDRVRSAMGSGFRGRNKMSENKAEILCIETNDRQMFFSLDEKGIKPCVEVIGKKQATIFTREEYRIVHKGRLNARKANSVAIREVEQLVRIVLSKDKRTVFALPLDWINKASFDASSGLKVLDYLITKHHPQEGSIIGFALENAEIGHPLLILYAMHTVEEVSKPQISVFSDDPSSILEQFALKNGIDANQSNTLILTAHDLLQAIRHCNYATYQKENDILGMPKSVAKKLVFVCSLTFCMISMTYAGSLWVRLKLYNRSAAINNLRIVTLSNQINQEVQSNTLGYAKAVSLDGRKELDRALSIWRPGATVKVDAQYRQSVFTLTFPVVMKTSNNVVTPNSIIPFSILKQITEITPPHHCHLAKYLYAGDTTNASAEFDCENGVGPIVRFRGN